MPRDLVRRIRNRINEIAEDPYASHSNVARLQGRPGFRVRVGDWRAIYELLDDARELRVLTAGHRSEVYR